MLRQLCLTIGLILGFAGACEAFSTTTCLYGESGTCRLTNGTVSDINAAIAASTNGAGTSYVDGVYVPSGSFTWASTINITKNGLVFKAPGTATALISCAKCVSSSLRNYIRISGFRFTGTGSGNSAFEWDAVGGNSLNVRFDNNQLRGTFTQFGVLLIDGGHYSGVIDHNDFNMGSPTGGIYFRGRSRPAFLDVIDFGSSDWVFAEDNTFTTNTGVDYFETHCGGKAVFRRNTVTEGSVDLESFFDQHNTQSPMSTSAGTCNFGDVGGRGLISAHNVINYTRVQGSGSCLNGDLCFRRLHFFRSGTGLIYDNLITWHLSGTKPPTIIELIDFRGIGGQFNSGGTGCDVTGSSGSTNDPSLGVGYIARCASTSYHPNGAGVYPQGEGYPNIGAPGRGLIGGINEPWYFWNNREVSTAGQLPNGVTMPKSDIGVDSTTVWTVAENREWCYAAVTQPTSCGPVSLTYTEYTYPHPLQGATGGDTTPPSAPTNLRLVSLTHNLAALAWDASTDDTVVTGYLIEHCSGASCSSYTQVGSPTGLGFSDTPLLVATSYTWRVRATDAANNLSSYSSTVTSTTDTVKFHPTLNLRRVSSDELGTIFNTYFGGHDDAIYY